MSSSPRTRMRRGAVGKLALNSEGDHGCHFEYGGYPACGPCSTRKRCRSHLRRPRAPARLLDRHAVRAASGASRRRPAARCPRSSRTRSSTSARTATSRCESTCRTACCASKCSTRGRASRTARVPPTRARSPAGVCTSPIWSPIAGRPTRRAGARLVRACALNERLTFAQYREVAIMRRRRRPRVGFLLLFIPIALVLGIWLGGHPDALPGFARETLVADSDGRLYEEAVDTIQRDYYREIDRKELLDKSLDAAVNSLEDQFSHYFTPREYKQLPARHRGPLRRRRDDRDDGQGGPARAAGLRQLAGEGGRPEGGRRDRQRQRQAARGQDVGGVDEPDQGPRRQHGADRRPSGQGGRQAAHAQAGEGRHPDRREPDGAPRGREDRRGSRSRASRRARARTSRTRSTRNCATGPRGSCSTCATTAAGC